jgi:hypothetical protein
MFEDLFLQFIEKEFSDSLSETVNVANDLSVVYEQEVDAAQDLYFEPFKKNPKAVVIVLSTTNASQTNIPQVSFTTEQMSIKILCDENRKHDIYKAIDEFTNKYNAVYSVLAGDTKSYNMQLNINKPFVAGMYDIPTESIDDDGFTETFGYITIQWFITAIYSDNIKLGTDELKIKVGTTEYPIKGLYRYTFSENPNSVIYQKEGQTRATHEDAVLTTTYIFNFQSIDGDALCELLDRSFNGRTGSIYGQTLSLVIDGETVEMSDYTLEKAYENGVKSYTLTLVK